MARGNSVSASADALTTRSLKDGAVRAPAAALSCVRSATASSMSTSTLRTKSGAVALDSAMRRATVCCRRDSSWLSDAPRPDWPSPAGADRAGSCFAGAFSSSSAGASAAAGLLLLRPAAGRRLDVGLHDPAARPRALERLELEAHLAGHPPRDRARPDAPVLARALVLGALGLGLGLRLLGGLLRRGLLLRALFLVLRRRLVLFGGGLLVLLLAAGSGSCSSCGSSSCSSSAGSSDASPMLAIVSPTASVSPSEAEMLRTPSWSAS